jgi:DNA-binding winged helix-turn-helix (wHTH) protein
MPCRTATQDAAIAASPSQTLEVLSFGPFELVARERLLTKEGAPLELGARALDILIALLSHPNEVINKRDLLARAWPDVTVEETSLRVHVARLRKALGDGKGGARYIKTLEHFSIRLGVSRVREISVAFFFGNTFEK